ncbi:hypothetical protein PLANPX_0434 [Lacipirellula parvula]|uniref:Carboxypeptidase regulatory-like domain-containing protein n=1 Tax=Lacipirellula parvula TaxID=2650471 RepID=A0A5K7X4T2_9BACT|nr:hypothetical protein PLANPX_0434 [Lacipirellula parvula]
MFAYQLRSSLLLAILACCLLGCGDGRPTRVPISGKITVDGQPLKFGVIVFKPATGRASSGRLDADGRYVLSTYDRGDGAIAGDYTVTISGNEQLSETSHRWHAPKKYSDPTASGLTATVESPRDDLNFELTWDGGKPFVEKF